MNIKYFLFTSLLLLLLYGEFYVYVQRSFFLSAFCCPVPVPAYIFPADDYKPEIFVDRIHCVLSETMMVDMK